MTQERWTAVDEYISELLVPQDEVLDATLKHSAEAGLPTINVAPNQGHLLMLLVMSLRANAVLEVGTLGGYSSIWMARGLSDGGKLTTLEVNPHHADVARKNIERAGLSHKVSVRVGAALDTLDALIAEDHLPFDLIFIDADKENNANYFDRALELSRSGSMIIVDNVVRDGAVIEADSDDSRVQGVRRLYERIADEPRVVATAVQTVGSKGYDGLAFALVK